MAKPVLTISSKNHSSWSLRGWLLCRMAGLDFEERLLPLDHPNARAELLLLSPTFRVPRLSYHEVEVWDTLAIAEFLHEELPNAGLLPKDRAARSHCRAISGEMHCGFNNLRSALPMNVKARFPGFKIWAGAQADIDHCVDIWRECLADYGGPFLFGELSMADAMFAPVCTRFSTYTVPLDSDCTAYVKRILTMPDMEEWIAAAKSEPEELEELDVDF